MCVHYIKFWIQIPITLVTLMINSQFQEIISWLVFQSSPHLRKMEHINKAVIALEKYIKLNNLIVIIINNNMKTSYIQCFSTLS